MEEPAYLARAATTAAGLIAIPGMSYAIYSGAIAVRHPAHQQIRNQTVLPLQALIPAAARVHHRAAVAELLR